VSGMIELLLLQPQQIAHGPRLCPREDAAVLEHEAADLLAMHALALDCRCTGANQIAHCLMALVGHPDRSEFAPPAGVSQARWRHAGWS